MLWFPVMQTLSKSWLHAILVFAAGVLAFLAFDATFEAFEFVERVPGVYDGELLFVLGVFGAVLSVSAISAWRDGRMKSDEVATDGGNPGGLWLAYLVALSIGLHNLAEGLAIGGSFALGRVSLGAFLVIGFMLHNVTEGPAVVAPLAESERPALYHFGLLGLIAGAPVVLGGWIGSLWLSPTVGVFFLALGVGAIIQVNWEILKMVRGDGGQVGTPLNLIAFFAGITIMYVTDIFVMI